jgi:uncharacterized protein YdaL
MRNFVVTMMFLFCAAVSFANTGEVENLDVIQETKIVVEVENKTANTLYFDCGQFYVCGNLVTVCDAEDFFFMVDLYC